MERSDFHKYLIFNIHFSLFNYDDSNSVLF